MAALGGDGVAFSDLQPGDFVEEGVVHSSAKRGVEPAAVRRAVLAHYPPPPERPSLDQSAFEQLVADIRDRVASRAGAEQFRRADRPDRLRAARDPYLRIAVAVEAIDRSSAEQAQPQLVMETRSDLVRSTLRSTFGKDLISIGYGAQFRVRSTADLEAAPHDRILQLLSPTQPRWRQHLRERPWRTLRYLVGDPSMRYAAAQRALRRTGRAQPTAEPAPYEMRDWVAAPES